jgi:hypothetical protein
MSIEYTYHDNHNIKSEVFVNNGKREGCYKEYYDDNKLKIICYYIDGMIEGKYIKYIYHHEYHSEYLCELYECDEFEFEYEIYNYINNKKNGPYIKYNNCNDILQICNYINDKIEGIYKIYKIDLYGNLFIANIFYYINNKIEGKYKEFNYPVNNYSGLHYSNSYINNKYDGKFIVFSYTNDNKIAYLSKYINNNFII